MSLLKLNSGPSEKELRWFAGLWWPAMCTAIVWMLARRFHAPAAAMAIAGFGALMALAGMLVPSLIRPLYVTLMRLTFPIGWVMSHIVLAFSYFAVVSPIGLLLRIFHDPMERKFDHKAASYWTAHEPSNVERYFRQL